MTHLLSILTGHAMRKNLLALSLTTISVLGYGAVTSPATAQVVVKDPSSIEQLLQQVSTAKSQLTNMQQQLETTMNMYKSLNGNTVFSTLLPQAAEKIEANLPEDWRKVYLDAFNGSSDYSGTVNDMMQTMQERINSLSPMQALDTIQKELDEKGAYDRAVALKAYNNHMAELNNIQDLAEQLQFASTPKEVLDLQTRINAMQGTIQGETAKIQLMAMLQKAQLDVLEMERNRAVLRMAIGNKDDPITSPDITQGF
ncbi:type IV secretion system protein [Entomobacter blattae]|uniref:Type IV secretion system protein n=1 Tax=Entomobacter blattae TaxID=2762277 RepID=A0A7H1NRQ4_9PROT|nr:type IV secretion system protein [Entomobacter blattae]QNT77560.1 Type IV secretion system protein [Entomobacter blattae]QNT78464.1 Type IV secretion system protein [Entomobacter blattae]